MSVAALFGLEARVAEASARLVDSELFPEELDFIRKAVPSRRAEFGTARVCARRALAELGVSPAPLVPGDGRAPVWPSGVVGSISHTHGHCVVVVAPRPPVRSIGLDVEVLRTLEPGVVAMILTARERAWLASQPAGRQNDLALTVFCAKEAFYKCQYPVTGAFLEFSEVEVDLSADAGTFEARVLVPTRPETSRLSGRVVYEGGRVACGVTLSE